MKKIFGVLVGMVVATAFVGVIGLQKDVGAASIEEQKKSCEASGGTFSVEGYSGGEVSTRCIPAAGSNTNKEYSNESEAASGCPCGYNQNWNGTRGIVYECKPCEDNVNNDLNGNTSDSPMNGGTGSTSKDTSGGTTGGSNGGGNTSGTGLVGNDDNSDARTKSECGDGQVNTFLFGDCAGGTDGEGVFMVLNILLQVVTGAVGIAGTLGIVLTGIQYMTARDDPAKMTKAKSRLIQIVIGLVAYAVLWAFLQWLLPGGVFGQ